MPKTKKTQAKAFHILVYFFAAILLIFSAISLTRYFQTKDSTPEALIPAQVEVFAYGDLDIPMLKFRDTDGYFRYADSEYYFKNTTPEIGIFSQEEYKNYNLSNLDTGKNEYMIDRAGYYFVSDKDSLKILIDFWESDTPNLKSKQNYQNLKANKTQGDGYVYLFPDTKTQNLFQGSVLSVTQNRATLLSFLNKKDTSQSHYGQDRTRLTGKLLPYVSPDSNFIFMTTDFAQRFETTAMMLAQTGGIWTGMVGDLLTNLEQSHPISQMLQTQGEFIYDGQNIISDIPKNQSPTDNTFLDTYKKYNSGSAYFALIFPQKNSLKYLEGQIYDDRMLTIFYFD